MSCQAVAVFLSCALFLLPAAADPAANSREIQRERERIRYELARAGLPTTACPPARRATDSREISHELWQIRRELEKANDPCRAGGMQRIGGGGGAVAVPWTPAPRRSLSGGKLNTPYKP